MTSNDIVYFVNTYYNLDMQHIKKLNTKANTLSIYNNSITQETGHLLLDYIINILILIMEILIHLFIYR